MLVLTVRHDEYIQVGDNVRIYNPNKATMRIAVDAPKEIAVHRQTAKNKTPKKQ